MKNILFELRVVTIVLILLAVPGANQLFQAGDIKQVLILNTYNGSAAPFDKLTDTFKSQLQDRFDEPIVFHSMDLNDRWRDVEGRGELIAQCAYYPFTLATASGGTGTKERKGRA